MQVSQFIQQNWMEWMFAIITFILGCLYRDVRKRLKEEQKKSTAIAEGVQSLLRESIVQNYNKYQERGYCPIYAKESIKRVYEAYHNLDGNDVATKLYETLLGMPEKPEEKEDTHEKENWNRDYCKDSSAGVCISKPGIGNQGT